MDNDKLSKFIQSLPAYASPKERGVYLRSDATQAELEQFRTKFFKVKKEPVITLENIHEFYLF